MNVRRLVGARTARSVAVVAGIVAVAGASVVLGQPAGATQITNSNLSVVGPVTSPCLTPSPTVNSPAGSYVHFTSNLFGPIAGISTVKLQLNRVGISPNSYLIGAGQAVNVPVHSGTTPFTYTVGNVVPGILGGPSSFVPLPGLGSATAKWAGQIVASGASNACSVQPQLPSVGVSPSLPGVSLPSVNVPGITPPAVGLPNPVGGLPVPGVGGSGSKGGSSGSSSVLDYTPSGPSLADKTVPHGYGSGSGAAGLYVPSGLGAASSNSTGTGSQGAAAAPAGRSSGQSQKAKAAPSSTDLASNSEHSAIPAGLPSLLVVLAMAALSAATAFYARTFLLHRPAVAQRPTK